MKAKSLPERLEAIARDLMASTAYSAYAHTIMQAAIELRGHKDDMRSAPDEPKETK